MIRKKKSHPITIDLTGPEGNAYVLMGYAKQWSEQLDLDFNTILEDMKSSDYEHLLNVLEKNFGNVVIFER